MLIRIVRMTFQTNKVSDFLTIFDLSKDKIRQFVGCHYLELLQDAHNQAIFSTYSHWESAQALENYRQSELFKTTWAATKTLFADRPLAFSNYSFTKVF
jgi:quinol monooxygenase YgiN